MFNFWEYPSSSMRVFLALCNHKGFFLGKAAPSIVSSKARHMRSLTPALQVAHHVPAFLMDSGTSSYLWPLRQRQRSFVWPFTYSVERHRPSFDRANCFICNN